MNLCSLRWIGVLLTPLLVSIGCNQTSELPPGGKQAVAHWHAVLKRYPDLPAKVQAITEGRGHLSWLGGGLPQAEVNIYGEDGVLSIKGRHVDLIVTDLDDAALRKLLAWWEKVPRLAAEMNLSSDLPFELPSSTRHVVVLGKQGRIEVSGPSGNDLQTINVLADDMHGRTTIGVHAFGPEGESALDQLAGQYNQVRGPPQSEVRAGRIALPPPEDNVTVLVIGQLGSLDLNGPSDDAQQQISFAAYLNKHQSRDQVAGVPAGTPFGVEPAYVAERFTPGPDPASDPSEESQNTGTGGSTTNNTTGTVVSPPTFVPPTTLPPIGIHPPIQPVLPPPIHEGFRPPLVVPVVPPVVMPGPPVVVPRFR